MDNPNVHNFRHVTKIDNQQFDNSFQLNHTLKTQGNFENFDLDFLLL